ncbi:conserved hypothetical protein [Leishmania braziliensis MHOM/BR/75/M2904]|uniref:Uncharacterized protein n=1 Tax=Leishmania braziliensis TaxID=5660 RepID=A4HJ80_LEIBR|nr:conserved hypothetical protein [Leishmania braziliensis MHOM/BR/75/M2904]CAM42540.1 conserved hypothetical protein [Leishmania braziliensis MHOM/BR/75/M2904]
MHCSSRLSRMSQKRVSEAAECVPEPDPSECVNTVPATLRLNTHAATVRMKEKFTAPFMVYDAQARRIVANPQYDRTLTTELHRVQSIMLTKLRTPIQAHLSYTPKELLYELETALFHVCASLAVQDDASSLRYVLGDSEADLLMPQLESFLAHHNAPAKAVVALAKCLSEGTSHDVLTSFLQVLKQRVQQELDPAVDRKRSVHEHSALLATKNNLQDIVQLMRDMQTAYHSIDTASQIQRRQPQSDPTAVDLAQSPAANAVSARIVEDSFYKVLRWVVAVDADRRALHAATTGAAATAVEESHLATTPVPAAVATPSRSSAKAFARVVEYDPFTGRVTLERADAAQRWGLLLNSRGLLVGVENELRNSSEAGERLYDAIQQQSGEAGGLAIFEVNRHRIRAVHLSDEELAASGDDIMQKLRATLTHATKTLSLTIERRKQADLTVPREVLFEVSDQGGEGGVGQRCLLMMERASTSISWGLKLKYFKDSVAVLSDFAPSARLSSAAKNLLFDMRGRLRVLKVNNQDMAKLSATEMKSLVSGSLLLSLHLQVTDSKGDVPPSVEAPPPTQGVLLPSAEEVGDAQEMPGVGAAPSEAQREAATLAEVEAAADMQAGPKDTGDSVQAELNDMAASIADEFLKQHSGEEELEAKAADKSEAPAVEEVDMVAPDPFEELDWAKPTATIGAPGDANDDEDNRDAEKDALFEESSRQQHYEEEDGIEDAIMEGFKGANDDEVLPKVEEADELIRGGEESAATRKTAEDAGTAEEAARDVIETGRDDAEAEPSTKTREHEWATAKKAKESAKKGKKSAQVGGRQKKGGKAAEAGAQDADDNEDEPAQKAAEVDEKQLEEMEDNEAAEVSLGNATLTEETGTLPPQADPDDTAVGDAEAEVKAVSETKGRSRAKAKEVEANRSGVRSKSSAPAAAADEETCSTEPEGSGKGSTSAPVDVRLIDLPPTVAEVAIEHGRERITKRERHSAKATATETEVDKEERGGGKGRGDDAAGGPGITAKDSEAVLAAEDGVGDVPRVSLSQLLKAKPLTFENDVRIEKFDGSRLELERSSTKHPWNIKVAFAGEDIIMTKLPPFAPKQLTHPFLRSLHAGPQGEVKWVVDGLNGQDLSVMSRSNKTKALDAIKGSTKLSLVLRALRK